MPAALKAELSKYLELAQNGEEITVNSHGLEIAKIGPAQAVTSSHVNWKEFFGKHPAIKPNKREHLVLI